MKVLELTCEPILYGGQEAFIFNFLENLRDKTIKVDVATLYYCDNSKYCAIAQQRGARIYELNLDFRPGKSRYLIRKPLFQFLENHHYDIIHIHSGSISALAYAAEAAKKSGVKSIIVHSHSTGVNNLKHKLIQSVFAPFFLANVSVYCACSTEAGQMKYPHRKWNDVKVLNNGIDLKRFEFNQNRRKEIRNQLGLGEDTYLVGQIGRFTFEKNQVFIAGLSNNICRERKDIAFLFIGDGELKENIKRQIINSEEVFFLDACDDIWNYYSALDLLVLPSVYEGIPMVSIEAQANGLPILASTGVSEKIEINENVKQIGLDDTEAWIEIITGKKLSRLSSVGSNNIIGSKWDINTVTDEITKMYAGLMLNISMNGDW